MHLYVIARGIEDATDRFISDMAAQYFPYGNGYVQLAIRPVQLLEIVFPRECLQEVCRTIWHDKATNKVKQPHPDNLPLGIMAKGLRTIIGGKPLPKIETQGPYRIVRNHHVACMPIGIKEDGVIEKPKIEEQKDYEGKEKL